jgi:hypothetical protein
MQNLRGVESRYDPTRFQLGDGSHGFLAVAPRGGTEWGLWHTPATDCVPEGELGVWAVGTAARGAKVDLRA